MTSIMICMAMNMRMISNKYLFNVPINGIFGLPHKLYKHPKYQEMDPIMCDEYAFSTKDASGQYGESRPLCWVIYRSLEGNYAFALPSVRNLLYDPTKGIGPLDCNCPIADENKEGCSKPTFSIALYGMSISNPPPPPAFFSSYKEYTRDSAIVMKNIVKSFGLTESGDMQYDLVSKKIYTITSIHPDELTASQYENSYNQILNNLPISSENYTYASNNQYTIQYYLFGYSNAVTQYFATLTESCIPLEDFPPGSAFVSPEAIENLKNVPPVLLVEKYYNCTRLPFEAFTTALGLSVGLTNTLLLGFSLVGIPLLIYMLVKAGYMEENENVKHAYSEGERKDANKNFMDFLLSLRDDDAYSKTTDSNGDVNIGNKLVLDFLNFTRLRNKKEMEDFGVPVDEILGTKNKNPLAFLDETNFRVETKDNTEDQADNKDVEGGAAGVGIEMKSNPMHK